MRSIVMTSIVAVAIAAWAVAGSAQAPAGGLSLPPELGGSRPDQQRHGRHDDGNQGVHVAPPVSKGRFTWRKAYVGQLLMIEKGKGLTQVRGQGVKEMLPGVRLGALSVSPEKTR